MIQICFILPQENEFSKKPLEIFSKLRNLWLQMEQNQSSHYDTRGALIAATTVNPLVVYQLNFSNPTYVLLTLLELLQLLPANGLVDKQGT